MYTNCPKCDRWAPYGICPDHGATPEVAPGEAPQEGLKECSRCRQRKPLAEFSRKSDTRDGYWGQCKKCRADYDRTWANRDDVREANLKRMRDTNNARRKNQTKELTNV